MTFALPLLRVTEQGFHTPDLHLRAARIWLDQIAEAAFNN